MAVTITFNKRESELIKSHAKIRNMSVSEFVREAVRERLENEMDLQDYQKAKAEFKKNPVTCSMEEAEKELELPSSAEADPFYSPENLKRLRKAFKDMKEGKFTQHELIEDE